MILDFDREEGESHRAEPVRAHHTNHEIVGLQPPQARVLPISPPAMISARARHRLDFPPCRGSSDDESSDEKRS